jgi:hypothetical protein
MVIGYIAAELTRAGAAALLPVNPQVRTSLGTSSDFRLCAKEEGASMAA